MNKLFLLFLLIPSICFADSKISQLSQDTSPTSADVYPIVKSADGNNYKVALSDLKTYINTGLVAYSSINQDSNGNIGINTTLPQANLTVKQTGTTDPFHVASSTSTSLLKVLNGGNIGIGSSNPAQLLDVEGNIYGNGNLSIGTTSGTAINVNYLMGLYGNTNTSKAIFVYNPNGGTSAQSRYEAKTLDANGFIVQYPTFYQLPAWAGRTILDNETGNGIAFVGNGGSIDFDNSTSNLASLTAGGNLGIGTSTPGLKLDVVGTVRASSFQAVGGNIGITGSTCAHFTKGICDN